VKWLQSLSVKWLQNLARFVDDAFDGVTTAWSRDEHPSLPITPPW
jgi:hypothetical protein